MAVIKGTPGVRGAESALERRLMMARHLDFFFARYGWTMDEYLSQERWLIQALSLNASVEEAVIRQQSASHAVADGDLAKITQ